jgi:RNA polymerase-interacting CarD/CdnL/TRCF family regulator
MEKDISRKYQTRFQQEKEKFEAGLKLKYAEMERSLHRKVSEKMAEIG